MEPTGTPSPRMPRTYFALLKATLTWSAAVAVLTLSDGCGISYPALLEHPPDGSAEFKYMYRTDQKDRRRVLGRILRMDQADLLNDPKIRLVSDRDSARLARVIELHRTGALRSDADKFYAASIYDHEGGDKMPDDTAYYHIAYELFKELYDKGYRKGMTGSLMRTSHERWMESEHAP